MTKKTLLAAAAGIMAVLSGCAHMPAHATVHTSQQYPFNDPWYPTVRAGVEDSTVLPPQWSVTAAYVEPMTLPQGAFALTLHFPTQQSMSQCPILPHWKVTLTVQPQLDGTRAYNACPSAGCYCAIFVPDESTKAKYETAIARYQPGAPRSSEGFVQFRIQ